MFIRKIFNIIGAAAAAANLLKEFKIPEKKDIDNKCENDCLCDRDNIVHAEDYRTFTLNKAQINNYKISQTKQKFIEEKINSPPIIYLF